MRRYGMIACVFVALTACSRWQEHPAPGKRSYPFPLNACLDVGSCAPNDASIVQCFNWKPTVTDYGLCTQPCTAWTEAELDAALATQERICLGWNGTAFDASLAGTSSGAVLVPCRSGDPPYGGVECDDVSYGSTIVRVYRPL